ncbi:hypothetical protein SS50377_25581 [Spironucleus salmonicida]|uniref:Uncharacterized protein n=1 Tax=Spironucleus salmonicida TaxID=348837 RepID=V6LL82_9EUKA|nr:hypothetical protein SS50377_25581 [Spironucleus salmonicida]|eukprot:EST45128.1 Hypothetical protein SS50377_15150 [Spironucleus salmonicida]
MKHETSTIDSMQQSESVSVIVQKYRDKYQSSLSDDSKSSQQSQEHKFQPAQPPTKQSAHPLSISNFQEDSSPKETLCLTAIQSTSSSKVLESQLKQPEPTNSQPILLPTVTQLIFTQIEDLRSEVKALRLENQNQALELRRLSQRPAFQTQPQRIDTTEVTKLALQTFVVQQFENYKSSIERDLFELNQHAKRSVYDRTACVNSGVFYEQVLRRLVCVESAVQAKGEMQDQEMQLMQNQIDSCAQVVQANFLSHKKAVQIVADLSDGKFQEVKRANRSLKGQIRVCRKIVKKSHAILAKEMEMIKAEFHGTIQRVQEFAESANSNCQNQRQFMDKISSEIGVKSKIEEQFRNGINKIQEELVQRIQSAEQDIQGLFGVRGISVQQSEKIVREARLEQIQHREDILVQDTKVENQKQIVKNILQQSKDEKKEADQQDQKGYGANDPIRAQKLTIYNKQTSLLDNSQLLDKEYLYQTPFNASIEEESCTEYAKDAHYGQHQKLQYQPFNNIPYNTDYGDKKSQKLLKSDIQKINKAVRSPSLGKVDLKRVIKNMQKMNPLEPEIYKGSKSKQYKRDNIDDILNKIDNMKRRVGQKEIYQMYSDSDD